MAKLGKLFSNRVFLAALGLVLLGVAVFWRVGGHDFLRYDDPDYVTLNTHVNQGVTVEGLKWAFGNLHGDATYWHPLTWVSHMIDCQLFGLRPGPHHLVSLAFHLLNVVLVFVVFLRMTGDYWPSLALAALWAVHPLQVDTVAWVTERKNLLSGMFWLLSMWAYVRYAEKPAVSRYLLVALLMALGLMTKPILVTLPCALLLLDFWPLRRWQRAGTSPQTPGTEDPPPRFPLQSLGRLALEKVPLLLLSLASSVMTIVAHDKLGSLAADTLVPFSDRVMNVVVSYARYVGKAVLPTGLSIFYPHPGSWPVAAIIASLALLLVLTIGAVLLVRRAPAVTIGWLWFLGVMLPTSGIVQAGAQSIADRFMYLPMLGLLAALVWGLGTAFDHQQFTARRRGVVFAGLVLLLGAMSSIQVRHWKDTHTVFAHALRVTDRNYIAYAVMGTLLHEKGHTAEAIPFLQRSIELQPSHHECRIVMGNVLTSLKRFDEAYAQYDQVVKISPRSADGFSNWAMALASAGRNEDALQKVDQAIRLNPQHVNARLLRALVLQQSGRFEDAAQASRQALALHPTNTVVLLTIGNSFVAQARAADALPIFRRALQTTPDSVPALNRTAWILATHSNPTLRNGPEALRLATRACELTGFRDSLSLNTLAAAQAEAGDFASAVRTGEQAVQAAQAANNGGQIVVIQRLLELYRAGTAYRE